MQEYSEKEKREFTWYEKHILFAIDHKGPRNLLFRSLAEGCHAVLSLILYAADEDSSGHLQATMVCQLVSALTLLVQFKTAHPLMFIVRACSDFAQAALCARAVVCGFAGLQDTCVSGWQDERSGILIPWTVEAIRQFLMGVLLLAQYFQPQRGLGQHGNDHLLYRGKVCLSGLVIYYCCAMIRAGTWYQTKYSAHWLEIGSDLVRAFALIPLSAWALFDQWVSCGSGKRTDDIRTASVGSAHPNHVNKLMHKVSPHKGHRNLLIRFFCTTGQASVTLWLIIYSHGIVRNIPVLLGQIVSAGSLFVQWRKGDPHMFLVRAAANWYICILSVYGVTCGTDVLPGETCQTAPWEDDRVILRILSTLLAFRAFCNGLSLFCQYKYPHRMFRHHGNEQLFIRGTIQLTGAPLHITLFFVKAFYYDKLQNKEWHQVVLCAHLLRGVLFIPASASSLYHQWLHTAAGNTGHPASDLFEREKNPNIEDPPERLRVTIFSAAGLRRADVFSSDPLCTCAVRGRPESKVSTKWVEKELSPVWNETFEFSHYRRLDSLQFEVRDHDEPSTGCCKFFDDGDDLLGNAILSSEDIHKLNNCYDGELHLKHAGHYNKGATLKVRVEVLEGASASGSSNGNGHSNGHASHEATEATAKSTPEAQANGAADPTLLKPATAEDDAEWSKEFLKVQGAYVQDKHVYVDI